MNSPCRDCPDRTADCHCTCEKYLAYQAERKEIARQRATEREMYGYKKRKFDRLKNKFKR